MRISVQVPDEAVERLDALAAARGWTRSETLRALIETGLPAARSATLAEAIALLSDSARTGSVPAQSALVRHLAARERRQDPVQARRDELAAAGRRREEAGR